MPHALHLLYGQPPRDLAEIPADAQQCSPLVPGSLALEECAPGSADSALVYAPPGTLERRYTLALALRALKVGTPLTALAPKDKGGSRLASELEAFGCAVTADSRQHHRIVHTTCPAALVNIEAALAEGDLRQYPANGLWTQPGIFSWDRLDEGSAVLLPHLPTLSGGGADLGCGLGVLSRAVLASPAVSSLHLIDLDRRAVEAAKRNITDPRAQFRWADACAGNLCLSGLDFVVMNPPFHTVGIEDRTLGQRFVTAASNMLKTGGELWCVANRHLPYEALMAKHFRTHTCVAEANGYKIIHAER